MDARIGPPPSKKLIISKNQGLDIFSSLQDEIIHHILSFASKKDAVGTCILSKRWLNLRISSPIIIFIDKPSSGIRVGLDVVDRTMVQHDPSVIKKIQLVLSSPVTLSRMRLWLRIAQAHNVQNLDLILNVDDQYILPRRLYGCKSLVNLKLIMESILKVPRSTRFLDLRSLYLSRIIFYDRLSFHRIVTHCPVLEELALINCEWKNIVSKRVTVPMLKILTIEQNLDHGNILDSYIRFSAPNLSCFTISSNTKVTFVLHQVVSLERVFLDLVLGTGRVNLYPRAIKLLKSIRYVKHLTVATKIIYFFLSLQHDYQQNLQPYENLTHLEIKTKYNVILSDLFMEFLTKVPNLEFLDLSQEIGRIPRFSEVTLAHVVVPHCFHTSLKKIRISNFEGRPEEMALLKLFLENATVLERLLIYFSDKLASNPKQLIEVSHRVEVIPRVSGKLMIYYSDSLLVDMES